MLPKISRFFLLFFLGLTLAGYSPVVAAQPQQINKIKGPAVVILAGDQPSTLRVPAPAQFAMRRSSDASNIVIDYVPAGQPSPFYPNNSCLAFPEAAKIAYQYAADIWASLVVVSVPLHIKSCWEPLSPGQLGGAGPGVFYNNFPNQPIPNTYYPLALINNFFGSDYDTNSEEISSSFSSAFSSWYFGTDGSPASNQYDFATVALHEIGHGLGFLGFIDPGGVPPQLAIFDRFTKNKNGVALTSMANPDLTAVLTGDPSNNPAYFGGANAVSANGGLMVPLFSPGTWRDGSSYSHLGESYNSTSSASMTYSVPPGESLHNPGPVTLGIMSDLGWNMVGLAAPAAPTNLAAVVVSDTQIDLTWVDHSSNETTFAVERSPDASAWSQIALTAPNTTAYSNTGLALNTRYYYRVRAFNNTVFSPYSNVVSATTTGLPAAPSSLAAVVASDTQINLTWVDNSNNETTFAVERSPDGSNAWAQIALTAPNTTAYSNTGLAPLTRYYYRVRAFNNTVFSPYSNVVSATTFGPPIAPTNLTATVVGLDKIFLKWSDNSANEGGFRIERSADGGATWTPLPDTLPNVTSLWDTGLTAGTAYAYRVSSFVSSYASAPFGPVQATTLTVAYILNLPLLLR